MKIKIRDWDKHFEQDRSRQWKTIKWVPVPNKQGAGYRRIMSEKNGLEIFGCWNALLQTASLCSPRGDLSKYSIGDLSRLTLCDIKKLETAIIYLSQVLDWIEVIENLDKNVKDCQKNVLPNPPDSSIQCSLIPSLEPDNSPLFEKFWKLYPLRKRAGKGAAEKAWDKIKFPAETFEKIKEALSWQIKSSDWLNDNGKYIPMPATYLNQRRWEDESKYKKSAPVTKFVSNIASEEKPGFKISAAETEKDVASPRDIDNVILGISKKIKDV